MEINAHGLSHITLNEKIRTAVHNGENKIILRNINGQRYIASGLKANIRIEIHGTAGNDLGSFMNGPEIFVYGNAQDAIANTMNEGKIAIFGNAGDVIGYAMRGGKLYIKGDVGYRTGIHMKAYKNFLPVIIIGGTARDFLGEYMAGGIIIVLGMTDEKKPITGNHLGTGMHGGVIYISGKVEDYKIGKEIGETELNNSDYDSLKTFLEDYSRTFNISLESLLKMEFRKFTPVSHRPYGKLYAY